MCVREFRLEHTKARAARRRTQADEHALVFIAALQAGEREHHLQRGVAFGSSNSIEASLVLYGFRRFALYHYTRRKTLENDFG